MVYAVLIILFTFIFLFDFLPIFKSKKKLEIWLYGIIFVLTFVVIFLHEANVNITGPDVPLKYFFEKILKLK